tara:strand:+ start:364 stop:501 length:138 start_codon:yes stop_codon:yes gene_type:complete
VKSPVAPISKNRKEGFIESGPTPGQENEAAGGPAGAHAVPLVLAT